MKRLKLCMLFLFLLSGCSSTPTRLYRPSGYVGDAWRIEAKAKTGKFAIEINDEIVMDGFISDLQKGNVPAAQYDGHTITATCYQNIANVYIMGPFLAPFKITVFVDGERAADF